MHNLKRKAILAAAIGTIGGPLILYPAPWACGLTLTWDPSNTTTGSDGDGTWDTTSKIWATGASDVAWHNTGQAKGTLDTAVFGDGGAGGWIAVDTNIDVAAIDFNAVGSGHYSIGDDTATIFLDGNSGAAGAINLAPGVSAVMQGLGGSNGIAVSSSGTDFGILIFDSNNSFTGGLTISDAEVNFGDDSELGGASGVTLKNGGVLDWIYAFNQIETHVFTFGAGGGTLSNVESDNFGENDDLGKITFETANQITGSGAIAKTGTGFLTLDASNNATGNWTISGGGVQDGDPAGQGMGSGSVTVNAGTEFSGSTVAAIANNIILNGGTLGSDFSDVPTTTSSLFSGTVTATAGTTPSIRLGNFYGADSDGNADYSMTIRGNLTGSGNLKIIDGLLYKSNTFTSAGPNGQLLTLSGNNAGYTGTLTIDGGHGVQFGATNTGTTSTSVLTHIVVNAVNETTGTDNALPLIAIGYNGAVPTLTNNTGSYGGVFAYAGTSTQNLNLGTFYNGNWYLGADVNGDTYSGASLTPGTSSGSPLYRLGGGGGTLTLTNAVLTNDATTTNVVIGAPMINGGGTVVFDAAMTYTGTTTVDYGTLQLDAAAALPTGTSLTLGDAAGHSGVLDLDGHNATVSSLYATFGAGTANTIGNSSTTAASTLTFAGGTSTFSGTIANVLGSGTESTALTVSTGSLTLTGTNTYAGPPTINSGGILNINAVGALPSGHLITNNGTVQVNANSTSGTISGTAGTLEVGPVTAAKLTLADTTPTGTQSNQAAITVGTGSVLDITNNSVILNTGTPNPSLSAYQTLVTNGYNSGTWTGTTSITSSWVATEDGLGGPKYGVAVVESNGGQVSGLTSSQIEIAPALLGDADLAGSVGFADYLTVLGDYGKTGQDWQEGNFDYTGTVDFADYLDVLGNYGDDSSLTAVQLAGMESFASENGYELIANSDNVGFQAIAVPEPASVGLLLLGGTALLGKRRRRMMPR